MYGQPPPPNSKPSSLQSKAGKWGGGVSNTSKPPGTAENKTFLHKSPSWAPKPNEPTKNKNDSPKKPWETEKSEPLKPWEKRTENNFKTSINAFNGKSESNEQSSTPNPPWGPKKNQVNKSSSFNSYNKQDSSNQESTSFVNKKTSGQNSGSSWLASRQQQLNKNDPSTTPSPAPTIPGKPAWLPQQAKKSEEEENVPPWKRSLKSNSNQESTNPPSAAPKTISSNWINNSRKPSNNQENDAAINSNESAPATKPKPSPPNQVSSNIKANQSSFLFRNKPQITEKNTTPINQPSPGKRKRRSLPDDVYRRPPPQKPKKPANAKLPDQYAGKPVTVVNSKSLAPPLLPPKPQGESEFPLPPSPLRNLPAVPPNKPSFDPNNTDDIYDDTDPSSAPPPVPPPIVPQIPEEEFEEIPTWDDEDEGEAVYDQTPEGNPMTPGIIPQDGEEMYEDLDQYREFKERNKMNNDSIKTTKDEEKSKKELKKEKAIRKKFGLPAEGEIAVECVAYVRSEVKSFSKLNLAVNEVVQVIRRKDNPKGKWLIRTENGTYGYTDSENLSFDLYDRRPTIPPPGPPPSLPARVPVSAENDGDGIYDETCDNNEELYEEL